MSKKLKSILAITVVAALAVGFTWGSLIGTTLAQPDEPESIPSVINYQGTLLNPDTGLPVEDGEYTFVFSIYEAATDGDPLWQETQTVSVSDGLFSVLLGSVNPLTDDLFSDSERYLGVRVGDDEEMSPRQQLTSVPYAFQAENADTLDGLDSTDIMSAIDDLTARIEALEALHVLFPTSYWYLDETGSAFEDHGSYGIDATELGSSQIVTGAINNGRRCSAQSSNIRLNSNTQYRWETTDKWSVEFWFKNEPDFHHFNAAMIRIEERVGMEPPEYPGEYMKWIHVHPETDGNFKFEMRIEEFGGEYNTLEIESTDAPYDDSQWHHWVITYDGSKTQAGVKMYCDGVLRTTSMSGTWPTTFNWTDSVYQQIGGHSMIYCSFDEVVIYDDYVLTQGDVTFRYNGGVAHRSMVK